MRQTLKKAPFTRMTTPQIYCSCCGKPILNCSVNEDGTTNYNLDFELTYGVHYKCYNKLLREQMQKNKNE